MNEDETKEDEAVNETPEVPEVPKEPQEETKEFQAWANERKVDAFYVAGALVLSKLAKDSLVTAKRFEETIKSFTGMVIK